MLIKFNNVYFSPEKFKLLSKSENSYILNDINFIIDDQMSAIVGPSGGGKTTIFRMISGELVPERGEVEILPEGITIGTVYQNSVNLLNPYRTSGELLQEVKHLRKKNDNFEHDLKLITENLGITRDIAAKKTGKLSGGQRQRIAIARQLLFAPDLLLLDEPFSAQDEFYKNKLSIFLQEFCIKYKIGLVCISHEIDYLSQICERCIVVSDGRIIDDGTFSDLSVNSENQVTRELLFSANL